MHKINCDNCVYYFLSDESKSPIIKPKYSISPLNFLTNNEINNVIKIHAIENYQMRYNVFDEINNMKIAEFDEDNFFLRSARDIKQDENVLLKYPCLEIIYLKTYLKTLISFRKYIYQHIEYYKYLLKLIFSCA